MAISEMRLFPPTTDELAASIRKTLQDERRAREWVFRPDPEKKALKVAEIDRALANLKELENLAKGKDICPKCGAGLAEGPADE